MEHDELNVIPDVLVKELSEYHQEIESITHDVKTLDVRIISDDCYKKLKSDCSKINRKFNLVIQVYYAIKGMDEILHWLRNSTRRGRLRAAAKEQMDPYC